MLLRILGLLDRTKNVLVIVSDLDNTPSVRGGAIRENEIYLLYLLLPTVQTMLL